MSEEEIDLSLALDPSDGKIPEETFEHYPRSGTFLDEKYLDMWKDVDYTAPCSVCGKSDVYMARYTERTLMGDIIIYCQECFYEHSSWAKVYKPVIEERARKSKHILILTILFFILIILMSLSSIFETLING